MTSMCPYLSAIKESRTECGRYVPHKHDMHIVREKFTYTLQATDWHCYRFDCRALQHVFDQTTLDAAGFGHCASCVCTNNTTVDIATL